LQINNWNENRKNNIRLQTNIKSIASNISADTTLIAKILNVLNYQSKGGELIIPILESKEKIITDSLEFILAFNSMTSAPHITKTATTWDYLNSSGMLSDFPDKKLLKMLEEYYPRLNSISSNFTDSGIPSRLEIRKLKYELFTNTEHRKFFPTKNPKAPKKEVYTAIFENERILPLTRYISSTSDYYILIFEATKSKAVEILNYIDKNYKE
jgi:hypothetical protein